MPIPSESNLQWRDALEVISIGVVIADGAGRVEYRNSAAREFDGTHAGALIDAAIRRQQTALLSTPGPSTPTPETASAATATIRSNGEEHRSADDPERPDRAGEPSQRGRTQERVEFYGPPRRLIEIMSTLVDHRDGGSSGVVSLIEDVSESDRIDRIRTDFVANVSHELKTPLGALTVLIDAIADAEDEQTRQRLLTRMEVEVERANRMVARLVELSEIESVGAPRHETVQVGAVVESAVARVSERAQHRGVVIDVDGSSPASQILMSGARDQLESALVNLIENAILYSDPGATVRVRVGSSRAGSMSGDPVSDHAGDPVSDPAGDVVEIEVSDQGIGIPQVHQERVFERFYRIDRGRSRATGGTGLGLAIVRRTALAHGGDVELESVEGEGSRFILRLPIIASPPRTQADRR